MVPNHQPVWVYMGSSSYKSLNIIHQPTITNHCQPLLTITQHTWLLPHMYRKQCFFWWPTLWVAVPGRVRHVHPNPWASWPGTTACGQTTLHKLHWVHLSGSHTCDDTGGWSQKKQQSLNSGDSFLFSCLWAWMLQCSGHSIVIDVKIEDEETHKCWFLI